MIRENYAIYLGICHGWLAVPVEYVPERLVHGKIWVTEGVVWVTDDSDSALRLLVFMNVQP